MEKIEMKIGNAVFTFEKKVFKDREFLALVKSKPAFKSKDGKIITPAKYQVIAINPRTELEGFKGFLKKIIEEE